METKEPLTLKDELKIWEKDPTGKCKSCYHATEIKDNFVKCNCEKKVFQVVETGYRGLEWLVDFRKDGFIKIFTAEYMSRLKCPFWSQKVE